MSGIEKLLFDQTQILFILDLGLKNVLYENIAKVSWENSKLFWKYQNFSSSKTDVYVHFPPIYEQSVKWRKIIKEMGGHIPGENFQGGIFRQEIFQGKFYISNNV